MPAVRAQTRPVSMPDAHEPRPTLIHASDGSVVGGGATGDAPPHALVSQRRIEDVRAVASPGEPHVYTVEVGGSTFTIRRPTRGMLRAVRRRIATECGFLGTGIADTIARMDGRLIEAEAYLGTCLTDAPTHWLADGVVHLDDLDEREIGAVWDAVRPWLAQFEDGAPPSTTTAAPPPEGTDGGSGGAHLPNGR